MKSNIQKKSFKILEESGRIDTLLSKKFDFKSRSYFQYLIENGAVLINKKKIKKNSSPKKGDLVEVSFLPLPEISLIPEEIPLDIVYEDKDIICINKKADMVVHPAPGNFSNTLANALLFKFSNLKTMDPLRPGIVHRLDKETSGILIAAKNEVSHRKLIEIFSKRKIEKKYICICIKDPKNQTISEPIGRHPVNRKKMAVKTNGKEAISKFKVISKTEGFSLVSAQIFTGRTHQIRVHLAHLKTPILGDELYGNKKINKLLNTKRQLLHAYTLSFKHPITGKDLFLKAPIPEDVKEFIYKLGFKKNNLHLDFVL
jgi:23S rRNA pseudouridine1911/1915/1917 synthase